MQTLLKAYPDVSDESLVPRHIHVLYYYIHRFAPGIP